MIIDNGFFRDVSLQRRRTETTEEFRYLNFYSSFLIMVKLTFSIVSHTVSRRNPILEIKKQNNSIIANNDSSCHKSARFVSVRKSNG